MGCHFLLHNIINLLLLISHLSRVQLFCDNTEKRQNLTCLKSVKPFSVWSREEPVFLSSVCVCSVICNLRSPMDCSPPGSSAHGIFQARILEWVAISSSMGSSQPGDGTHGSYISRHILYPHHGQDLINCGLFLLMTVPTASRNPPA